MARAVSSKTVSLLFQKRHTLKIYWNYFATSHGKGPVDRIGGMIKRMTAQKVVRREVNSTNAESFYEGINGESNVKVFLVKAEEIRIAIETHQHAVISTAPVLPGIFRAHYLQHEDGTTNMKPYSTASYNVNQLGKTNSETSEVIEIVTPKVVEWYQWEKVPGPNGKEYLEKVLKKGTALELYDAACAMWPSFLLHYFIKQKQANAYEDHKSQVQNDSELAVRQIDFAENFSTLWQDEVQSAHWNKKQITVFTSVTWQQDSCTSAVIISDDLTHSRDSIIIFIDKLLTSILDKNIKKLHIWSDGPSSQFKNRFIAASKETYVKNLLELFCNISWERTSR